jgi:hypothetical protein
MNRRIQKLVLAVAVAISLPAAAVADDCDHGHRRDEAAWPASPRPEAARRWREAEWREHRLQRIRSEIRALDLERADFHARNAWSPRRLRRYDRWYVERRAELERRYAELQQQVAWR